MSRCKVGGKQCLITPDGFHVPLHIKNGLPYLKMRPPTDRELSNPDIPHVVLTSDVDWDPSVLDSIIEDMEEWMQSIPEDKPDEVTRPFDSVGILKNNIAVTNLKESTEERLLDLYDASDSVVPTDGLFESHPRSYPELDWFECNMLDIMAPPIDSLAPVQFEVFEARKRPSVMLVPEEPIDFDIKSAPLRARESIMDLMSSKEPTASKTRRSTRSKSWDKRKEKEKEKASPPPRVDLDADPPDNATEASSGGEVL